MGRTRTRSDDEILDAVGRVVGARGPSALTLAEVAREAGLAPATLVQRFGSKRALLAAFAKRAADRAPADLAERIEAAAPAARRRVSHTHALRDALVSLAEGLGDRGSVANGLAFLVEDVRDAELRRSAKRHAERTEAAIARHLEAAARAGELATRDVPAIARAVQAAYNGALVQWALRGTGPIGDWVGETVDIVLALARRESPRRPT